MNEQVSADQQNQPANKQVQVDMDFIRTSRIHIAIPCYGGLCSDSTALSLVKWSNICRIYGIDWTMETLMNESLISRARNTLVSKFLVDQPGNTHLMFIDADIGFDPWHILALINHDVDLVGGLYPLKSLPIRWCVNGVDGGEERPSGLTEVSKIGTGFMLIKRGVFAKMKQHKDVIPYKNDIGMDAKYDREMYTFFDTVVRNDRYLSEDWKFCDDWRDLGGKVWIDKRVLLRHTGAFIFANEVQEMVMENMLPTFQDYVKRKHEYTIVDKTGNPISLK